tara:strand:- start:953 stop:1516 length:564 start_codon:yes stop_codon:yes gene_type:complete
MSTIQLQFKTLIHKMAYVKADLEFHRAEHAERRRVFHKEVNEFIEDSKYVFSSTKANKNMVDVYKKTPAVELPEIEQQTKEIFKKVAKMTHPDIDRKKQHKNKFIEAREALDDNDWFSMYKIGSDLGIDITGITMGHVEWLKQEIAMIEEIIKGIVTTFEWIYSNEGANKEQLLTTYCMLTCKLKDE